MANYNFMFSPIGTITANYKKTGNWKAGYHTGIDVKLSDPAVKSFTAGKVINISGSGSYGNAVYIQDDNGYINLYAHMADNSIRVKTGDTVNVGTVIGTMGNTGNSSGTHLHYEVRKTNKYGADIDPGEYLNNYKASGSSNNNSSSGAKNSLNGGKGIAGMGKTDDIADWFSDKAEYFSTLGKTILLRIVLFLFAVFLIFAAIKKGFLE